MTTRTLTSNYGLIRKNKQRKEDDYVVYHSLYDSDTVSKTSEWMIPLNDSKELLNNIETSSIFLLT
jgi:hypothetical protein